MTKKKHVPARRPAEQERDRRNIARLYLQGKIQAEIAYELKISQPTVSRELKLLQDEWKTERAYDINEAKARELARIDVLENEYWRAWERSQKEAVTETESDTPQGTTNTTKTEYQVGNKAFLDGVADCIDMRLKILGLYAPNKNEVTGKDGKDLPAQAVMVYLPENNRDSNNT